MDTPHPTTVNDSETAAQSSYAACPTSHSREALEWPPRAPALALLSPCLPALGAGSVAAGHPRRPGEGTASCCRPPRAPSAPAGSWNAAPVGSAVWPVAGEGRLTCGPALLWVATAGGPDTAAGLVGSDTGEGGAARSNPNDGACVPTAHSLCTHPSLTNRRQAAGSADYDSFAVPSPRSLGWDRGGVVSAGTSGAHSGRAWSSVFGGAVNSGRETRCCVGKESQGESCWRDGLKDEKKCPGRHDSSFQLSLLERASSVRSRFQVACDWPDCRDDVP